MKPKIVILCGGDSHERPVSLISGKSLKEALESDFAVELIDLQTRELPASLNKETCIVFPAFHGEFGEDGQVQSLLEEAGIEYVGSDSTSSALCIDKIRTLEKAQAQNILIPKGISFDASQKPDIDAVVNELGDNLVVKPYNSGSTIGLTLVSTKYELLCALDEITEGKWIVEERIFGSDFTVAILNGKALGTVEIRPINGIYDYAHKYTPGATEYIFPAPVSQVLEFKAKEISEAIFSACGCRDFARADFMLSDKGDLYFLEINTIPGFTPTSLFPKSASVCGLDVPQLAKAMVMPAVQRFVARFEPQYA